MNDNVLIQKIIDSQELKTVQFNIENISNEELNLNLFDLNSLYPTTNQTQNQAGSVNPNFNVGTGFDLGVYSMKKQSDGKIILGGDFSYYNGIFCGCICRLNSDGSFDNTFNAVSGGAVSSVEIQIDGKIIVGGSFTSFNGNPCNYICRLNSDGSFDNTFNVGTAFNSVVTTTSIQSDGKVLVGGDFTSFNGNPCNFICRLNSDGSFDNTFNTNISYINYNIYTITTQIDGKILVGGSIYTGMLRLNSDGSVDTSFLIGTGFDSIVRDIKFNNQGKIIVVGDFYNYNSVPYKGIIKLNSDGSIDNDFNIGTGFDSVVYNVLVQSDDKMIVGGSFENFNSVNFNKLIRLNSDGSIDYTFNIGLGISNVSLSYSEVYDIVSINDDEIIVGGYFDSYNGNPYNFLVGLYSTIYVNNYNISGSVNYDFFVQTLNNDPKIFCDILIKMPQRYLANPLNVIYTDANGQSTTTPYLPNTDIDAYQKSTNRGSVKFNDGLVVNINTQIGITIPPLTTVILLIDYKEFLKSDMLDLIIYGDDGKAKYCINESLENGEITANKYWGSKSMPKKMVLDKEWLTDLRTRFSKVELLEYDQPKLAGGTIQTREMYQDLFGFSKQVKEKYIGITEAPKFKKGVEVKLSTKRQSVKPKKKI